MPVLFLYICLVIQLGLAFKIFLAAPGRKLNIYLALIPAFFVISTVLEINFYYITDQVAANKLYHLYQCFAFCPLIFLTLALAEYIILYEEGKAGKWVVLLRRLVLYGNFIWIFILIFIGPSARIFLSAPGKWSIDNSSITSLFLMHTYSSMVWLAIVLAGFIFMSFHAEGIKRKRWFRALSVLQTLLVAGIFFFILSHKENAPPQYDLIASVPSTIGILLQLWVLSGLSLFDINAGTFFTDAMVAASDWFIVLDKSGKVKFMNKAAHVKTGYPLNALINIDVLDIMEVKDSKDNCMTREQFMALSGNTSFFEIIIKFKKTGTVYNVQSSIKSITLPDSSAAFLWVVIDTTKIVALKIQKEIVEEKSLELSKVHDDTVMMMNMTSHDLKAPLKTIAELAGFVKEELLLPGTGKSAEYLDYISSISDQSLSLATQMIEFMRIKVIEKKKEFFEVEKLIESIKERFVINIRGTGAVINYTGIKEMVSDPHHISELLANLIDNSIKYRSEATPLINITVSRQDGMYQFSVQDNGIGIHNDFIPKAFSKYTREKSVKSQGSGIGLFICKSIIDAHGGEVNVVSNAPDKGITILFTIAE